MNIDLNTLNFVLEMLLKMSLAGFTVLNLNSLICINISKLSTRNRVWYLTIVTDELLPWAYKLLTHWGYRIGFSLFDVVACRVLGTRLFPHSL